MRAKIFRYAVLVGVAALLLSAGMFFRIQLRAEETEIFERLAIEAEYAKNGLARGGKTYLAGLPDESRITWIDRDGTVLYDSAARTDSMENHLSHEEIRQALEQGEGRSSRFSKTLQRRTFYYALRMSDGTVLRVSCDHSNLGEMMRVVALPGAGILVLVLLLSVFFSDRLARQIVRPINSLDMDQPRAVYPELGPLVDRLRSQNETIADQMADLRRRQEEFSVLTDSMREGFLLLGSRGEILSANHIAQDLLAPSPVQTLEDPACEQTIVQTARRALKGSRDEARLNLNDRVWQIIANPVRLDRARAGAVLLMLDITERDQRERLRREFSANVSHELKTPLTAISGFAELMKEGMVPPEQVKEFAGDIYDQSRRLMALVEDILDLSRLEENTRPRPMTQVDLSALAGRVMRQLEPVADRFSIRLEQELAPCTVLGDESILEEMLYNLIDNAIKYNRPGGWVRVSTGLRGSFPFACVADNGIGIPPDEHERVFERFYRVDKSRSRAMGGTGLGLSIVKHGATYHNARLSLDSAPGKGSRVTLTFSTEKH